MTETPHRTAPHPDATQRRAVEMLRTLTPEQRLSLLHQHVPPLGPLGLDAFHTGTEALHGVAWLGDATVFPQPVGLAATWDDDLVRRVGEATGREVRAKHAADPTVSLNVWAPVVNPLRHPAWGRNEEGYSEDPHVTADVATAYCRGLRGNGATWRTVPTLKHLLGYGNETDRAVTSSHLPLRALHEWELPAYRRPLAEGVAGAVMPSYNLVNGRPAHVARGLLDEMRSWASGTVTVVSDAAAPGNLVTGERFYPDHVASHAACLRAGVDSFTDNDTDTAPTLARLRAALDAGILTPDDVDRAAARVLELRLRAGEGSEDTTWDESADTLGTTAHLALARDVTARGVVLLRNDAAGGTAPLPLPADARRIAVVGPLADRVLHDWYSGTPLSAVGLATALTERFADADVVVADGADRIALRATSSGRYLAVQDDRTLVADHATASPATHLDVTDWGDGLLSLRSCTSELLLSGAGWIITADAERIGGWTVQESFRRHVAPDGTWALQHVASGRWLRVQHGSGLLVADATTPDDAERFVVRTVVAGHAAVAEAARGADAVLVVVGNDPHLAGRETEDRPHLSLPEHAVEIWRAARDEHPGAVLTIVSSYPYVLGPAVDDAAAVVWSAHGGSEHGRGLADVLTGDVGASGRLTQQWPRDAAQAGPLLEHDVRTARATYRWTDVEPAFAFGHGLTYGQVRYIDMALTVPGALGVEAPAPWGSRDHGLVTPVTVAVTVANDGTRNADELVQVYGLSPDLPVPAPRRLLLAAQRVTLAPGERRTVTLTVDPARLAVWDTALESACPDGADPDLHVGAFRLQPGRYTIAAGPSAADLPLRDTLEVRGEVPAPRRPTIVLAHAFSEHARMVTSERTRDEGWATEVAPGARDGELRHDRLDLAGTTGFRLTVAGPGSSRPTSLWARPTGTSAPWVHLGDVPCPAGTRPEPRYGWTTAAVDLSDDARAVLSAGPVDVLTRVPSGVRLANLTPLHP
ncbi:glycoside hydrolase family 3 C-terminal domain-containing protein [Flavimobilis rhizosphaerae]|uniref:glycoside hydrolase family 3 C-terminal domain-containing protein n=1 Tax=Flavimobilis rhizosphaerae TaxID=2775421 RepID=UPI002E296C17|nr:glycoside hydrolase family 3 C-terminal domain-containing protein [Flavimobilis rhizosphaerae]